MWVYQFSNFEPFLILSNREGVINNTLLITRGETQVYYTLNI